MRNVKAENHRRKLYDSLDKENGVWKRYYESVRNKFFDMYGGCCSCCGESEREFLSLDHVEGQIGKKKEGHKAYRTAIKELRLDKYRILCHNCNQATKHGKICPHRKVLVFISSATSNG